MNDFADRAIALAPAGEPSVRTAEFPVSAHAITTWCAAIGEQNSLHLPTRGADQLAPMSMLQTWAAPRTEAGKRRQPTVHARVRDLARRHGYDSIVATDYELNQYADLRVNDTVTERCWVGDVSEPKSTRLGDGQFVTINFSMGNQHGHEVGSARARTFYYRPRSVPNPRQPDRVVERRAWETLEEPEVVDVTRTFVIAGALASNDHEAVHLDHAVAREQGLPDIILSILTTAGLVCAYAHRRWRIEQSRHLRLRLAAPVFPGDRLVLSGRAEPDATVPGTIEVRVSHERGIHCTAAVAAAPASRGGKAKA